MSALSPAQRSKLSEPVAGQGELFAEREVPRRRSAPPKDADIPAQRRGSSSTARPARGRR